MHVVHAAKNAAEAYLLRAWLADQGIESIVLNEALQGAQGDLGLAPAVAMQVAILDARDGARAYEIVMEFVREAQGEGAPRSPWVCASCGEENEASFDLCWKCETERAAPGSRSTETGESSK